MALESATYISDLVSTNPTGSDGKAAGDDHIRLLKSTVKATFPNVTGAVTPTHTELNYVNGVTSAIQTQLDAKNDKAAVYGTLGTHVFAKAPSATIGGATIAGSSLEPAGITTGGAHVLSAALVFAGTWRCLGYAPNGSDVSLFVRVI